MPKIVVRLKEEERKPDMFRIDIQRNIQEDLEDEMHTDTISLEIGGNFKQAVETFDRLVAFNILMPGLVYIRLCVINSGVLADVLTRRTPSGSGDW